MSGLPPHGVWKCESNLADGSKPMDGYKKREACSREMGRGENRRAIS